MNNSIQTQKAPKILLAIMAITVLTTLFIFRNSTMEPFDWIWIAGFVCFPFFGFNYITRHMIRWGNIEWNEEKIRVRDLPPSKWTFEWEQIEGFGVKRVLFMEFPTIKPKRLLIPRDEIVIFHQYGKPASEVAESLNKYHQNKTVM